MALVKILLIFSLLLTSSAHALSLKTLDFSSVDYEAFEKRYGPTPWILLGGFSAATLAYLTRKDRAYRKRESFEDTRPLGNYGFIGDIIGYGFLNGVYTIAMGWRGWGYDDLEAKRSAELMARVSAYTLATTMVLKTAISEKRPGYPDDDQSFPSGHAAASFAFASVVTIRHGWGWGSLAHGLAGFIAISRVNDDFHYMHDIIAGATIGAAYAWGVHQNLMNGSPYWFSVTPVPKGAGLVAGLEF